MNGRTFATILLLASLSYSIPLLVGQTRQTEVESAPVNPNASPEARALLHYLYSISGKHTITGQNNFPNHVARWTDRAYDFTAKYPGLYGQDFGFAGGDNKDSVEARPAMIEEVKRQYERGAVIALTWHAVRPSDDEPVTFQDSVQGRLSDFEWNELITPGTHLNDRWCAQVDVIAGYLKQLRDAHIPVLFRPYHEVNGSWFWWGGRSGKNGSEALYRQLFDRFVNHHHLDNLVWVWNASGSPYVPPMADFYPGSQYVDILSSDVYVDFDQSYYNDTLALASGKPIALGEVGAVPSPDVLRKQPRWTYFMIWSEFVEFGNTPEQLQAVFHDSRQLNRDDSELALPMTAIRQVPTGRVVGGVAVTPGATAEAQALLSRLYSIAGKSTLSGQKNLPGALNASTKNVIQYAAKQPAIYGAELEVPKASGQSAFEARQQIVEEAKRQAKAHAIVSISWHAPRPTGTESSAAKGSSSQLSDFEWSELLTPGTRLHERWLAQVDDVAKPLKQLQEAGVPVLWQPYPLANSKDSWWAGRKGNRGTAALYRQLFNRLVNQDGLHNLIWVWNAAADVDSEAGDAYENYFPGLLYVDALSVSLGHSPRGPVDSQLAWIGAGKVIGIEFAAGKIPPPETFESNAKWAWFLIAPDDTGNAPDRSKALSKLYGSPRVVSLPLTGAN